jgi:hypothetical protein
MVEKILKNIKNYNLADVRLHPCPANVREEEGEWLAKMAYAEKELVNKFNFKTISELNNCYQHMVEYYCLNNVPYFEIFTEKITKLLQRTDVQLVMSVEQSKSPTKSGEGARTPKSSPSKTGEGVNTPKGSPTKNEEGTRVSK